MQFTRVGTNLVLQAPENGDNFYEFKGVDNVHISKNNGT